ncbi:MAG: hypothetical protein M1281_07550 [Chloroflexi bacterium]|nr:hypothetical protein [Chloroflexota bacterium]
MGNLNGEFSQKKSLSSFRSKALESWWEVLLLAGLGALAVALHQFLRLPLHLPGRHGIEWMALLLIGRGLSRSRYSGSIVSIGAAVTSALPIWAPLNDPFTWLTYLLPGLVVDLAFARLPRWAGSLPFLVVLGAVANTLQPLVQAVLSLAAGIHFGALGSGLAYPVATHLLSGFLGGLLGGLIVLGVRRAENRSA